MKFQPGQSGNPAGRPLGSRNKETIAREKELAARAEKAVDRIIFLAGGGHAAAMRICAEWVRPGGNSRALALELPRVTCADDAQAALDMVMEAFGDGAITVREFPTMLGSVDRMARIAERIQQNRERERERYGAQRVHGIHPDMIPKVPPGWADPLETLNAALERGENPFPDDPEKLAYVLGGEEPCPPVHADGASVPRAAAEGGSPERSEGEPTTATAGAETLYSPVNLNEESAEAAAGEDDALYSPVNSGASGEGPPRLNPG